MYKSINISVVDPNPKESVSFGRIRIRKKFGFGFKYGFRSRHCCKIKFFVKIADQTLAREKKVCFFYWKTFFSSVQVPKHIGLNAMRGIIYKNFRSKY
jgi:hypothetical protein